MQWLKLVTGLLLRNDTFAKKNISTFDYEKEHIHIISFRFDYGQLQFKKAATYCFNYRK